VWRTRLHALLPFIRAAKFAAAVLLVEQLFEVVFLGVSLAHNPTLAIAALGALAAPVPRGEEG
jgi:hypothetical protein